MSTPAEIYQPVQDALVKFCKNPTDELYSELRQKAKKAEEQFRFLDQEYQMYLKAVKEKEAYLEAFKEAMS